MLVVIVLLVLFLQYEFYGVGVFDPARTLIAVKLLRIPKKIKSWELELAKTGLT